MGFVQMDWERYGEQATITLRRCEREVVEGCHAGRRRLKPVTAPHKGEGISCGWPRMETGALRGEKPTTVNEVMEW